MMWKIVESSKVSVLYIYIDNKIIIINDFMLISLYKRFSKKVCGSIIFHNTILLS